jgi:hypothetical protein
LHTGDASSGQRVRQACGVSLDASWCCPGVLAVCDTVQMLGCGDNRITRSLCSDGDQRGAESLFEAQVVISSLAIEGRLAARHRWFLIPATVWSSAGNVGSWWYSPEDKQYYFPRSAAVG